MPKTVKELHEKVSTENEKFLQEVKEVRELQSQNKEIPQELQHVEVPVTTPHNEFSVSNTLPMLGFGAFFVFASLIVVAFLIRKFKKHRKASVSVSDKRMEDLVAFFEADTRTRDRLDDMEEVVLSMTEENALLKEKIASLSSKKSKK